jgi:Domain of unknown function (DUF4276)
VRVHLYIEGGGDNKGLKQDCRRGFMQFLQNAGFKGRMPGTTACGGRDSAFDKFKIGLATADENTFSILLVDSEEAVTAQSPWEHLKNRQGDNWAMPDGATDEQAHLMVECMENWFLADKEALAKYFGQGFKETALPQNEMIENVSKKEVLDGLQKATSHLKTKTEYSKGRHSFDILARIDPDKVRKASPYADRLFETLDNKLT